MKNKSTKISNRQTRLSQALRANLLRRKSQARQRKDSHVAEQQPCQNKQNKDQQSSAGNVPDM